MLSDFFPANSLDRQDRLVSFEVFGFLLAIGSALPAAIGIAAARGDGSLMMHVRF